MELQLLQSADRVRGFLNNISNLQVKRADLSCLTFLHKFLEDLGLEILAHYLVKAVVRGDQRLVNREKYQPLLFAEPDDFAELLLGQPFIGDRQAEKQSLKFLTWKDAIGEVGNEVVVDVKDALAFWWINGGGVRRKCT